MNRDYASEFGFNRAIEEPDLVFFRQTTEGA
jgi:hypothetical protein